MEKAKVAGHEGLVKDLHTQAVINSDADAFKQALSIKQKRLAELRRVDDLELKVQKLESLIEKLLEER